MITMVIRIGCCLTMTAMVTDDAGNIINDNDHSDDDDDHDDDDDAQGDSDNGDAGDDDNDLWLTKPHRS